MLESVITTGPLLMCGVAEMSTVGASACVSTCMCMLESPCRVVCATMCANTHACSDGCLCMRVQACVRAGFSGVNCCCLMEEVEGADYAPYVRSAAGAVHPPAVSSQSMCCGDLCTVLQVGTVGEAPDKPPSDNSFLDARTGVLHAALCLVHPANGSGEGFEVFTGEQLSAQAGQMLFYRNGLPPMPLKDVSHPCPLLWLPCQLCLPLRMHNRHIGLASQSAYVCA